MLDTLRDFMRRLTALGVSATAAAAYAQTLAPGASASGNRCSIDTSLLSLPGPMRGLYRPTSMPASSHARRLPARSDARSLIVRRF